MYFDSARFVAQGSSVGYGHSSAGDGCSSVGDGRSSVGDDRSSMMTAIAQFVKTPRVHGTVAGSIPAVTPRYCTNKIRNALQSTKKKKRIQGLRTLVGYYFHGSYNQSLRRP
jgi:hypothetical protein